MPKPSRWTAEKRYEIVTEILKGKEPITQIARKHQVSDALIHRWRDRFYEGGKAALNFEGGPIAASRSREQGLEQESRGTGESDRPTDGRNPFFKKTVGDLNPSWSAVEKARVEEGMTIDHAMRLLDMSRSSYYRHVRGMVDYPPKGRAKPSLQHQEIGRAHV